MDGWMDGWMDGRMDGRMDGSYLRLQPDGHSQNLFNRGLRFLIDKITRVTSIQSKRRSKEEKPLLHFFPFGSDGGAFNVSCGSGRSTLCALDQDASRTPAPPPSHHFPLLSPAENLSPSSYALSKSSLCWKPPLPSASSFIIHSDSSQPPGSLVSALTCGHQISHPSH